MSKLRVWWIPQLGIEKMFYVPVNTPEEGRKILDVLLAYDAFQFQNNVKPDYNNVGGLEMFDEEEKGWVDWCLETENEYFDDVDAYCEQCEMSEELAEFRQTLFERIDEKMLRE